MKMQNAVYPILIFILDFVKFRILGSKIQVKGAKRPVLSYLLLYFNPDDPSHRVSYKLTKKEKGSAGEK